MKFLIICLICKRTIQDPEPEDAPTTYAICEDCKKGESNETQEEKEE